MTLEQGRRLRTHKTGLSNPPSDRSKAEPMLWFICVFVCLDRFYVFAHHVFVYLFELNWVATLLAWFSMYVVPFLYVTIFKNK